MRPATNESCSLFKIYQFLRTKAATAFSVS